MSGKRLILLIGYANRGNFGDDSMIEAVQGLLPGHETRVIDGRMPTRALLSNILAARALIVCGGHVIGPRHGSYLKALFLATLLGRRIGLFSIELSAWPRRRLVRLLQWLVLARSSVSLRTTESAFVLRRRMRWKLAPQVIDVFYLHSAFNGPPDMRPGHLDVDRFRLRFAVSQSVPEPGGASRKAVNVIVLPRSFPAVNLGYTDHENVRRIDEALRRISGKAPISAITVSPSSGADRVEPYFSSIHANWHAECAVNTCPVDEELTLGADTVVITNRLHLAKACLYWGVEVILVSYDRKTEFPESVGINGEILLLDGSFLPAARVSVTAGELASRRGLSRRVFSEMLRELT